MKKICGLLIAAMLLVSCGGKQGQKPAAEGKKLGTEDIVVSEPLKKKFDTIIVPDFSFENTSIQEVDEAKYPDFKKVVHELGTKVPDQVAANLREMKVFKKVERVKTAGNAGANTVVLNGRFTTIASGNRALRLFVGFGAGTSTVGVDGELSDASSKKRLARFIHNRHSPASMGDYHKIFAADGKNIAHDIALFIKRLYYMQTE